MMTTFAILMLLYNMWLIFYLVMERRQPFQESAPPEKEKPKPVEEVKDNGIVGKSNFKMPSKVPPTVPDAATADEGEAVNEEDITFADETDGQIPEDLTQEELAEMFSDHRSGNVKDDDDWDEEDGQTEGYASGASFEDIDTAVRTAKKVKPTKEEKRQAGKVFTQIRNSELFDSITESMESVGDRVVEMMDLFLKQPQVQTVRITENIAPKPFKLPDNIENFDIRDFV
ncbi:conjugal transfer protein TraD [Bacteroides sp. 14(A)]|uniref:conjugal transfer protein TraD n=1 Tax=Bacteroides sp. 14(A) TaxID=1163670 RepID=UPI0012DD9698|nr:conjugal transfer protein TraD [Bacteroides sp. 14(A)]